MIQKYSRVNLNKQWAPHLKVSPKPFYNQFGTGHSFIFIEEIVNDPGMCLVLDIDTGKILVGKTEFFDDPVVKPKKVVDKLKGMGLLEDPVELPVIVEMTHSEIIREYYD